VTRGAIVAGLLLLTGCGGMQERKVDAVLAADLARGEVLIRCRESSSDSCHALFVTEAHLVTAQAKVGESASASGLGPETRYCVDAVAPNPAKCRLRSLANGEQIVRNTSLKGN
jgi:hypothetical protein